MNKKLKITLASVGILLTLCICIGISYAYWLTTKTQTDTNVARANCFDTQFIENSSAINLEKQFPVTDEQGEALKPYSFTIKNTCTYSANYQINLETIASTLKLKNLRVKIGTKDSDLLSNYAIATKVIDDAADSRKLLSP